jgi:hypothetical protein
MDKIENTRQYKDQSMIDWGMKLVQIGAYDSIHMECWNKEEADKWEKYCKKNYPSIKITFSWGEWR